MLLRLIVCLLVSLGAPAFAAGPPVASGPSQTKFKHAKRQKKEKGKKKSKEEMSEEDKKAAEEEEKKRQEKLSRVVVLKWEGTSAGYSNDAVVRVVRSAISRPDAMFFPEVDLYQSGRKVRDRTVIPVQQPARVPDVNIPAVIQTANQTLGIRYDQLSQTDWRLRAEKLKALAEQIWFVDRPELREPLFMLYIAIGYSADCSNQPSPPFYDHFNGIPLNYYYYLAALLAYQEPALLSKIPTSDMAGSIQYYLQQLQQGAYPSFKLDFELEDHFESKVFSQIYEVLLNGLPITIDDNGQIDGYLGRTDIYLKRLDSGHGMSERLETTKFDENVYFVRETARKKMGVDFIQQLFLHKNECIAEVDGDILAYLAIYQKLHPKAEIYIAVPEKGNPNKIYVWRYVRDAGHLRLVYAGGDGFPVRFALVLSSGAMFNGGATSYDTDASDEDDVPGTMSPDAVTGRFDGAFANAFVPFNLELRAHYNRLMISFGWELGLNTRDGNDWIDRYFLPKHQSDFYPTAVYCKRTSNSPPGPIKAAEGCNDSELYHITHWNRNIYLGLGGVFGRDAGIGFGPRLQWRNGYTNLPHAWQSTLHFGWAVMPPIGEFNKRFRPVIDADFRGGFSLAAMNSVQRNLARGDTDLDGNVSDQEEKDKGGESVVMPVFGMTVGIGFTF
jgi:hypothetical protein